MKKLLDSQYTQPNGKCCIKSTAIEPHLILIDLIGILLDELIAIIIKLGGKPFYALQLWQWIYKEDATNFDVMTNLTRSFRQKLAMKCTLNSAQVISSTRSFDDNTWKYLIRFQDGTSVETVFILEKNCKGTICLSTQAGCALTCTFCYTGMQKFVRNLTTSEIINQFLIVRRAYLSDSKYTSSSLRVVMMGMGEPLLNYNNTIRALKILVDPRCIGLSRRRVTLSTSGIAPMIRQLSKEISCNLAVSLHAATDSLRDILVPINKKYPLSVLMAACRQYLSENYSSDITFEYIMLSGVNDSRADANATLRLVRGIPCKFNLIPFNSWPGTMYTCSTEKAIRCFAEILSDAGYLTLIRETRGRDINAACGQLCSRVL